MLIKCMNHLERFMNRRNKLYISCILLSTHQLTSLLLSLTTNYNVPVIIFFKTILNNIYLFTLDKQKGKTRKQ